MCFIVHKLVIKIDEDGHPYYENDQIRQKLKENLDFTFIRIDPGAGFYLDVEIAKIYNYINDLPVTLAEKSLKEKFAKELLSYMSSVSKPLKYIMYFIKKILPIIKT